MGLYCAIAVISRLLPVSELNKKLIQITNWSNWILDLVTCLMIFNHPSQTSSCRLVLAVQVDMMILFFFCKLSLASSYPDYHISLNIVKASTSLYEINIDWKHEVSKLSNLFELSVMRQFHCRIRRRRLNQRQGIGWTMWYGFHSFCPFFLLVSTPL